MFNRCTLVIYKYTLCVKNTRILGTGFFYDNNTMTQDEHLEIFIR